MSSYEIKDDLRSFVDGLFDLSQCAEGQAALRQGIADTILKIHDLENARLVDGVDNVRFTHARTAPRKSTGNTHAHITHARTSEAVCPAAEKQIVGPKRSVQPLRSRSLGSMAVSP